MKLQYSIATLVIATVLVPMAAMAEDTNTQSQIQALREQIKTLQQQLQTLIQTRSEAGTMMYASTTAAWGNMVRENVQNSMASTTWQTPGNVMVGGNIQNIVKNVTCVALNRSLSLGSRGDDVKKLQEMLAQDPENEYMAEATGYFGQITARAMAKFQTRMGIASSTDGVVGPLTRGFFERMCQNQGANSNWNGTTTPMGTQMFLPDNRGWGNQ